MAESYGVIVDLWDRVLRLGLGFQGLGVVDIREDGFELVQIEFFKKEFSGSVQELVKVQISVFFFVFSQYNYSLDLRVVNVLGDSGFLVFDRAGKFLQVVFLFFGVSSRDFIIVSFFIF